MRNTHFDGGLAILISRQQRQPLARDMAGAQLVNQKIAGTHSHSLPAALQFHGFSFNDNSAQALRNRVA